jgi:hypothetical protein
VVAARSVPAAQQQYSPQAARLNPFLTVYEGSKLFFVSRQRRS